MKNLVSRKGFTLVETLVAISIIMFAVAGPLYTAGRAIVAAGVARDQLTASYLAQEGIEYVRMMRDNQYLGVYNTNPGSASGTSVGSGWYKFLNNSNIDLNAIKTCKATNNFYCNLSNPLSRDPNAGINPLAQCTVGTVYTTGPCAESVVIAGSNTSFKRTIQATDLTNEEKITSTVTWSFHGIPYTVTVTDHLTPWQ